MAKLFGEELKQSILRSREITIAAMRDRAERIANCETDYDDCFMSSRGDQQAMSNYDMQLEILAGDGLMDFEAVMDENGNEVWVKWVNTKYGLAIVGRGIFASSLKALLKKTGWHTETIRVPAWTKFVSGNGRGLCGVYSGDYQVVRWHTNMVTGEYVGYPE